MIKANTDILFLCFVITLYQSSFQLREIFQISKQLEIGSVENGSQWKLISYTEKPLSDKHSRQIYNTSRPWKPANKGEISLDLSLNLLNISRGRDRSLGSQSTVIKRPGGREAAELYQIFTLRSLLVRAPLSLTVWVTNGVKWELWASKKPGKCLVTYFEPKYLNIGNKVEGIRRDNFDWEGRLGLANVKYLKMINKNLKWHKKKQSGGDGRRVVSLC